MRLFLFIALGILAACTDSKETRLQRYLIQGNEMVSQQNTEKAIEYYNAALKLDGCFVDAQNNLGTVYHTRRDYAAAIEAYTKALECQPDFVGARLNRANSYYESNELYAALKDLETVRAKRPDTLAVHFLGGMVQTRLRNYGAAKASFKKAMSIDPTNDELKVNLGTVYYYDKKYDSARTLLEQVVQGGADVKPEALNALAMIEIETGRVEQALDLTNRAIALKPNDPYFLNNRGFVYLQQSELEKALEDINKSITIDPYNGWAYRNKGIYYLKLKQADEAIRMFTRAEKTDPFIQDLYFYFGQAYLLKQDSKQACIYFRKSVEAKDGRPIPAPCTKLQ